VIVVLLHSAFVELLLAPASKVLNSWFESDVLKATLATDAVIGAMASVHTPGSGYVLLHHVMGETNGARGIWSYVEGGMGSVSMAIARAAQEAGATLVTNVEAKQFLVEEQFENIERAVTGEDCNYFGESDLSVKKLCNTAEKMTEIQFLR
jgi:phytoene dehydrogenase-like protein